MGIDLNHEFHLWRSVLGFDEKDMNAMTLQALNRSFLEISYKNKLHDLYFSELAGKENGKKQTYDSSIGWATTHQNKKCTK